MAAPVSADAAGATASVHATRAVQRHGLLRLENPAVCRPCAILDTSSGAQSLDGGPSDGEPALSPNGQKLGPNTAARKCSYDVRLVGKQFSLRQLTDGTPIG